MNTSNTPPDEVHCPIVSRRQFITLAAAGGLGVAASLWGLRNSAQGKLLTEPGRFADELTKTPAMAEGPFYPDKLPLDTDNDLLILNDALTPAVGKVTHLSGRVLTTAGIPVAGAFVEIWQVDNGGIYLHSRSSFVSWPSTAHSFRCFAQWSPHSHHPDANSWPRRQRKRRIVQAIQR